MNTQSYDHGPAGSLDDLARLGIDLDGDFDIDAALSALEQDERQKLGLQNEGDKTQWTDANPQTFTAAQRAHTTILVGGLTMAHDYLIQQGLRGVGYNMVCLDVPDTDALRYGKEFGNRGQCNPTYFTVGNLVKHLDGLRKQGIPTKEIIENYVFVTAGACGPCRFGTYVTEYRKALRDAGFDGFRVMLFQQQGGLKQATGDDKGLKFDGSFFRAVVKGIVAGDVLNALGYRIRPYEVVAGSTDRALEECKRLLGAALESGEGFVAALWKCRRVLAKVQVDRTVAKPKVALIGEFWAMTTEGDGNYRMPRFLESEGAEVDVQLVTAWLLFMLWENVHDTEDRMTLRQEDGGRKGTQNVDTRKKLLKLRAGDVVVRTIFQSVANILGLHGYHLPDMHEVANVSRAFYNNNLRGGEGHMEVGKLILNVMHSKVNMTLSVKPFGCMPSSGVSDGVQSFITELYPQAIFLPIETTGDGAVNVYSRVQMMLFKAKQQAQREQDEALAANGMTREDLAVMVKRFPWLNGALFKAPHHFGSTAADVAMAAGQIRHPLKSLKEAFDKWRSPEQSSVARVTAVLAAKRASAKLPQTQRAAA